MHDLNLKKKSKKKKKKKKIIETYRYLIVYIKLQGR